MSIGRMGIVSQGSKSGTPTPPPVVYQENDITFYDYDGTIVYSCSRAEAQEMTKLPTPPVHDRLTFDGWTHTLVAVKGAAHKLDVGAMYYTTSGMIEYEVQTNYKNQVVKLPIYGSTVDWGDGTNESTTAPSGLHSYSEAGTYSVKCSGPFTTVGDSSQNFRLQYNPVISCYLPESITSIDDYAFADCSSLQFAVFHRRVTIFGYNLFQHDYSLQSVVIPNRVATIRSSSFTECRSLQSVVIPESVTELSNIVFYACYSLQTIICYAKTPPTLQSNSITTNDYQKIYVPAESVEAYKTATNWSTYADKIYPIEE